MIRRGGGDKNHTQIDDIIYGPLIDESIYLFFDISFATYFFFSLFVTFFVIVMHFILSIQFQLLFSDININYYHLFNY